MSLFVNAISRLRLETKACVAPVHHSGHDKSRERGSTALRAAADTMVKIINEDGLVTVSCDKQRDSAPFSPMRFRLAESADSVVLRRADDMPADLLTDPLKRALEVLLHTDVGTGVSNGAWRDSIGSASSSFYFHRKRLLDGGYVEEVNKRWQLTSKGSEAVG